jgi:hypothetical protein
MNRSKLLLLLALPAGCDPGGTRDHPNLYVDNRSSMSIRVSVDDSKLSDPIAAHAIQKISGFYPSPGVLQFFTQDGKQSLLTEPVIGAPSYYEKEGGFGGEHREIFIYPPPASYWNTHSRYQP